MDAARIAELLQRFAPGLSPTVASQLQIYFDLLLKWNARINLTSVRDPEQIVTRHFGESLFAARALFGCVTGSAIGSLSSALTLADIGSGAGFPGIPIKLLAPQVGLTLIESHAKKATFLREVLRTLQVGGAEVFCDRAEQWGQTADVVTMRAVEHFERILPVAAALVAPGGRLCLLIGAPQAEAAAAVLGREWQWQLPQAIPDSSHRVVLIGTKVEIVPRGTISG